MGMFDYVKFEMPCALCKAPLTNFQSKDGECQLEKLNPIEVDQFYTFCEQCNLWIMFNVTKPKQDEEVYYIIPAYMDFQDTDKELIDKWSKPDWNKIFKENG